MIPGLIDMAMEDPGSDYSRETAARGFAMLAESPESWLVNRKVRYVCLQRTATAPKREPFPDRKPLALHSRTHLCVCVADRTADAPHSGNLAIPGKCRPQGVGAGAVQLGPQQQGMRRMRCSNTASHGAMPSCAPWSVTA